MELSLQKIHVNRTKCHSSMQITLEDDIIVPDTKPDIEALIKKRGRIQITEARAGQDKVIIRGILGFTLLYVSNEDIRPIHNMTGQIPFEESLNMDTVSPADDITCTYDLEDCQVSLINSRKISVRAIVSFHCCVDEEEDTQVGVDIISEEAARAGMELSASPEGLHKRFSSISYTQTMEQKKDIFRMKDTFSLPKGKPNLENLLYYEMTPQNLQTRLIEDGIRVTGDLQLFVLYVPENEERRLEYLETELPIDGVVNCSGCDDSMIPDITFLEQTKEMEVKTDDDGEQRLLELELILSMDMKFYQDQELQILQDAYSTACQLRLTRQPANYERLLVKNQGIVRISDRIRIDSKKDKILQICTCTGNVQIDEQEIVPGGIQLEGIVELDILYITENDNNPLGSASGMLPFSHFLEVKDISPQDHYQLQSDISQISVIMLDAEEVEAKVVITLNTIVFTPAADEVITDIEEAPLNLEKLQSMPGIVGYIATEDGTLWELAKEYSTSPESIMELNGLSTDKIHQGDKLLLMKQVDGL